MKNTLTWSILLLAAALVTACGGQDAIPPAPEPMAELAAEPAPVADAVGSEGIVVAVGGTKFAPPIDPELLPEGVWYCDMGTVHYARVTEGDGRCAVCGMHLKQLGAEAPADEGEHAGHEH